MATQVGETVCQIPSLQRIVVGRAALPPQGLARLIKLFLRRRLSPRQERALKAWTNDLLNWTAAVLGRPTRPAADVAALVRPGLRAGEWVRVRSRAAIEATLNHWRQLQGCTFMPEMEYYCGSTQRVLKRMERFVDERDLRVKKARGIVLLEGAMCQGTADFGPCDRSCLFFWREEWLERIPAEERR